MSELIHLNDHDYQDFLRTNDFVIADYYADWCPPCQMLGPIFEQVASEFNHEKQKVAFVKINIDEASAATDEAGVMSVPTLIIYKKGEEVDRHIGGASEEDVLKLINSNLDQS